MTVGADRCRIFDILSFWCITGGTMLRRQFERTVPFIENMPWDGVPAFHRAP